MSLLAAAVAGLVVLGACSSDSDGSLPLRTVPTTVAETTTTTGEQGSDTTPAPSPTTTSRRPVATGGRPPASAKCTTVGFTPQSEDAASSIVATGLSCDEAESFLRRLGPSVGTNGPARIEREGFQCVLTRYQDEPLPQGFYECTSGSKRITFVRS